MLIAHVITRLLRAGSEENTLATCVAQAQAGHEVHLLHGNEWDERQLERYGSIINIVEAPNLVHPVNPVKDLAAIRHMKAYFQRTRPTVVHTHQSKAGIIGRVAAKMAHVPVVIHGVHTLPFVNVGTAKKVVYLTAERAVARITHAFVNVSEGTRDSCIAHYVGRPEQHFVARSGMDIERFRQAQPPEDWRALLGIGEGEPKPPVILMLAALESRKRHVQFLECFYPVIAEIPNVRLLLAGEGPMRAAIEDAISSMNLADNVRLLGYHSSPEQLLSLCDLTVLTSFREGLPRVFVQSLAAGKPVVTTKLAGVDELVKHGVNGIVTPGEDVRDAAVAIARLLGDPGRLAAMQLSARATDVSAWSVESMCRDVASVYDRVIQTDRNAA